MNPEAIVLSGKGIKAGKIWLAPIQQAINEFCIPALTNDIEVKLSSLGTNAQLIGAAALTIEKISDSFFDTYENELTENQ
jgi:predicted NBD/HSP70 family sugar kinase